MNLVNGELLAADSCSTVLEELEARLVRTLSGESLSSETVVNACDRLVSTLDEATYIKAMEELGIDRALGTAYLAEARQLFSRDGLTHRLRKELGDEYDVTHTDKPLYRSVPVTTRIAPLGVLLHIAAGNADGLPVFSVLEGLLTGNINILKLPASEGGISVRLLQELIHIEPRLAEYIYVFDYSSKDIEQIGKLIDASDAVVVWGGKEAVSALRGMVPPHIRLIEWGHKISFGYVTPGGITPDGLRGLAENIAVTGQLLCSSLQGIFVDTAELSVVHDFCTAFLPVLEQAVQGRAYKADRGIQAQAVLRLYNAELERIYRPCQIFRGDGCSLSAYPDAVLETGIGFGNVWVRPLPHNELLSVLRPYKNYLQTVGLLCVDTERGEITDRLFKTGVVRVCSGEAMSIAYSGMPHDGEYPLRRYTKTVSVEP